MSRLKFEDRVKFMTYERLRKFVNEDLEIGQFFLHSLRKVRNNIDPERFKVQLMGWERVANKQKEETLLKKLNEGDPRFEARSQPGWIVAEPEVTEDIFGIPLKDMEKLEMFAGKDVPMAIQKRGVHFHWIGLLSPRIDGVEMHVQINEFTSEDPISGKSPKIVPSTSEVITFDGIPIYRNTTIVLGKAQNVFLPSDGSGQNTRLSFGEYKPEQVPDHVEAELQA